MRLITVGVSCVLCASCGASDTFENVERNSCTSFEVESKTGQLRILMVNQSRMDEEIFLSNLQCNDFDKHLYLSPKAREELARLVGVDSAGGIHAGIYVVDLTLAGNADHANQKNGFSEKNNEVQSINSLVSEIEFDEMASAFSEVH